MSMGIHDHPLEPVGFQQLTPTTAEPLQIKGAEYLLIQAETADVRWRDDGVAPTLTIGFILPEGFDFWYTGDPKKIKAISTGIVNVAGYR
jgi:hypothetical protein